jgi:hypothetical protein
MLSRFLQTPKRQFIRPTRSHVPENGVLQIHFYSSLQHALNLLSLLCPHRLLPDNGLKWRSFRVHFVTVRRLPAFTLRPGRKLERIIVSAKSAFTAIRSSNSSIQRSIQITKLHALNFILLHISTTVFYQTFSCKHFNYLHIIVPVFPEPLSDDIMRTSTSCQLRYKLQNFRNVSNSQRCFLEVGEITSRCFDSVFIKLILFNKILRVFSFNIEILFEIWDSHTGAYKEFYEYLLCWFLSWFILRSWRWRQYVPPKRVLILTDCMAFYPRR